MHPDDLRIEFRFDEEYRQSLLETGDPDQWIDVSIAADGAQIFGDDDGGVTGFACGTALNLLDSVESVERGQNHVVDFEYGPTWLAIEPVGEGEVRIAGVRSSFAAVEDPSVRRSVDRHGTVLAEDWRREVLETAREFRSRVARIDPNVENHESLREIRDRIEAIESAWGT